MWSYLCCFGWLKFSKKVQRSKGVRHDPSKHGHFRAGATPGVYKRRKVSRMAGTISAEDVGDENSPQNQRARSPLGSDRSEISPAGSSGRLSPIAPVSKNPNLVVPQRQGLRRFLTPSIAASTPDLRSAQENELKNAYYDSKIALSNKDLNATWLSSQSISNLSVSNYDLNISSKAGSNTSSAYDVKQSQDVLDEKETEKVDTSGGSAHTRKRDYLTIPFLRLNGKKKSKTNLATSTPDISKVETNLTTSKPLGHSTFYLGKSPDKETSFEGVMLAQQHGLDLDMYKGDNLQHSIRDVESNRVTDKHVEYTFGTAVFTAALKNGMLSVSLKKLLDLPYKGTKPLQYSVLVKFQIIPENKKYPTRYAGSSGDKKSPNPVFEEDFHWTNMGDLTSKFLSISVYERGRRGNYDAIGHMLLHLGTAHLQEQPRKFSSSLKSISAPTNNQGTIQLSLDFKTAGGKEIEIHAYSAKDLQIGASKSQEPLSTYVKASFYVKGKKEKSKKSVVVKEDSPFYNHIFKFNVPSEAQLMDSLIVVSVVHKTGKLGSEQLVGKVMFGPYYFLKNEQTDWGNAILKGQKNTKWYDLHMI